MTGFRWSLSRAREYSKNRTESPADRAILNRLRGLNPETVIEIGCGPGVIRRRADFIENYVCADLSIHFLRELSGARVCCDGCALPFRAGSAGCMVAMAVLHHLECEPLRAALNGIHRVLRPGGTFLLLEDWCFVRGATPFEEEARKTRFKYGSRENHLAGGTWLMELREAGFSVLSNTWVERPFHTHDPCLLRWPEEERRVRMLLVESLKPL